MGNSKRDPKRVTREFMAALSLNKNALGGHRSLGDRLTIPLLLGIGIALAGFFALRASWPQAIFVLASAILMLVAAASPAAQARLLGQPLNRRHAFHVLLLWISGALAITLARILLDQPVSGKFSAQFYQTLIGIIGLSIMAARSLLVFTVPRMYRLFATDIPIWEQVLLAANETIAILVNMIVLGTMVTHVVQPDVFTLAHEPVYTVTLLAAVIIYYAAMQGMWVQRWNDAISKTPVWLRYARFVTPLLTLFTLLIIARRLAERADLRSATLVTSGATNLAVLAITPVILQLLVITTFIVFTSRKGLRQRFLPDMLLERLPERMAKTLRTISDMDLVLIIGILALAIPAFLLFGGTSLVASLGAQILQQGGVLIETQEQVLSLLVAFPFYLLMVGLLLLYAFVIARSSLSARDREELMTRLPVGFLIIMIISLYLFAVPFSQALIEGRLPRLPQDTGRILLYSILIPVALLYGHYFLLVRLPYSRGQGRWRSTQNSTLSRTLESIERRINTLNQEIERIDRVWHDSRRETETGISKVDTLYRYVQLNGMRDDLNMQRLQVVQERQQLTELSDAPISLAVARLPVRVVSIGIPLLIIIQVYQWAVINNELSEIINNPNLTVIQFFREILSQFNF
ncbi:MAG: hypothetical protein KME04_05990 [Pleurocapsa minor GSE-CHR-MK-17-07R]|jgi:TM2 domain-containing membrane protein YozV|nr:hypothetical protein [Pleurocapsa minor GSE-CHR-MK 17-07R]